MAVVTPTIVSRLEGRPIIGINYPSGRVLNSPTGDHRYGTLATNWEFGELGGTERVHPNANWKVDEQSLVADLERYAAHNIRIVRWFILGDGMTLPVNPAVLNVKSQPLTLPQAEPFDSVFGQWPNSASDLNSSTWTNAVAKIVDDLRRLLQIFRNFNNSAPPTGRVLLMPCLFSFEMFSPSNQLCATSAGRDGCQQPASFQGQRCFHPRHQNPTTLVWPLNLDQHGGARWGLTRFPEEATRVLVRPISEVVREYSEVIFAVDLFNEIDQITHYFQVDGQPGFMPSALETNLIRFLQHCVDEFESPRSSQRNPSVPLREIPTSVSFSECRQALRLLPQFARQPRRLDGSPVAAYFPWMPQVHYYPLDPADFGESDRGRRRPTSVLPSNESPTLSPADETLAFRPVPPAQVNELEPADLIARRIPGYSLADAARLASRVVLGEICINPYRDPWPELVPPVSGLGLVDNIELRLRRAELMGYRFILIWSDKRVRPTGFVSSSFVYRRPTTTHSLSEPFERREPLSIDRSHRGMPARPDPELLDGSLNFDFVAALNRFFSRR